VAPEGPVISAVSPDPNHNGWGQFPGVDPQVRSWEFDAFAHHGIMVTGGEIAQENQINFQAQWMGAVYQR